MYDVAVYVYAGQLVRGFKALQENWRVTSQKFPTISPSVYEDLLGSCLALQTLQIQIISRQDDQMDIDSVINCNLTMAQSVFGILSLQTDWNLYQDVMYMPFAYCEEYNTISEDDANELKTSLYDTEDFLTALQFYCFLIAFICAGYLIFHVYYFHVQVKEPVRKNSITMCDDDDVATKLLAHKHSGLEGGADAEAGRPLLMDTSVNIASPLHEQTI
jgi:hypothetical protein